MERQAVPISEIARRLTEIAEQQRALEIERAALEALRARAITIDRGRTSTVTPGGKVALLSKGAAPATSGVTAQTLQLQPPKKPGASEAIVALLRAEPRLMPADVVRRLEGQVETKAGNPKKMLFQTIANLTKRRRLIADGAGRLIVADE